MSKTYLLNETLSFSNFPADSGSEVKVEFVCVGRDYMSLFYWRETDSIVFCYSFRKTGFSPQTLMVYKTDLSESSGTWTKQNHRLIYFPEDPTGTLLTWLNANGTVVTTAVQEMTSPYGRVLNTAEKFVKMNIKIVPKLQEKTAVANGEYTPDPDYVGLSKVIVTAANSQEKTVELTSPSSTIITPDSGKLLSKVTVTPKLQAKTVTELGTIRADNGYVGLSSVKVTAMNGQEKNVNLTSSGTTTITPDSGKLLSKVTVTPRLQEKINVETGFSAGDNGVFIYPDSGYVGLSKIYVSPFVETLGTAAAMNSRLATRYSQHIIKYTGTDNIAYKNGHWYRVITDSSGNYLYEELNVGTESVDFFVVNNTVCRFAATSPSWVEWVNSPYSEGVQPSKFTCTGINAAVKYGNDSYVYYTKDGTATAVKGGDAIHTTESYYTAGG